MTSVSALKNVHKIGLFGDYDNKEEKNLLKISEIKNLLIVQIVQYKDSTVELTDINVDGIKLDNQPLKVNNNTNTRIIWCGPRNWLLVSTNKDLLKNFKKIFSENDFAITDVSHSRAIIEIQGIDSKEVLKKGCPYNFNELNKNYGVNSLFNGITVTIDMIDDNPNKIRIFTLRSFGESLYHSIVDACLEYGYKSV